MLNLPGKVRFTGNSLRHKVMPCWQVDWNSMKIRWSNQKVVHFPPREVAGMTLVEVVIALAITV